MAQQSHQRRPAAKGGRLPLAETVLQYDSVLKFLLLVTFCPEPVIFFVKEGYA
jgi:hypothetical protein